MDDLLSEFLTEANESLERLDAELVRLEQAPDDPAPLAGIFRLVHTIKGTCGFLGLPRLEALAHAAETVLGRFRAGELAVTPAAVGLIFDSLDRIRALLAALAATRAEPDGDDSDLIARLAAAADGAGETAAPPAPSAADAAPSRDSDPGGAGTARVPVALLDELVTMAGELVLARNQLLQMARRQPDSEFAAPLQRLGLITSGLQDAVMRTRMQPVGTAWARLPRLGRELARELGKRIEIETRGGDTELDRQIIERIRDPLTHMVRNAADHGIETPAARAAAGKPETGRIALEARHEGGHVVIRVSDDGAGVDLDRVRRTAAANGLASPDELAALSDRQLMRFLFRPGFSTAAAVTTVSGRGVGMDVVRTNIETIGGQVALTSEPGRGACFTVRIPLTLAVLSALIVESIGMRFAVPRSAIAELVGVAPRAPRRIETVAGMPVLRLRDGLLPLVALDRLLAPGAAADGPDERVVAVLRVGAARFGLVVDRVFDCEDIVVKPVAPVLRHPVYGGATILGDGGVAMILDPAGIAAATGQVAAGEGTPREAAVVPVQPEGGGRTPVLLFRAGGGDRKAVPLARVARLEEIEPGAIEEIDGRAVVRYRGRLMPLLAPDGVRRAAAGRQNVVVLGEDGRLMGLMVDEILDVVEDRLRIELPSGRADILGTAVIAGRATQMLDAAHYLARAFGGPGAPRPGARGAA